MPTKLRTVAPGDALLGSDHNGIVEHIAALWTAVERQQWSAVTRLAAQLAARIRFVRIKAVHSGGVTTTDPAATPPADTPDNVTYDVVLWGDGTEFAGLRPRYNRPATGGDVKIRPAKVDAWARLLRGVDASNEDVGELEILSEEFDRAECTPPTPEQQRGALLAIARTALELGIAEGMLGTPVLLTDAPLPVAVSGGTLMEAESMSIPAVLHEGVLDLSQTTARVRVPIPSGVRGLAVYADPEVGTWARTLDVRHAAPSSLAPVRDFAVAKSITAAGARVLHIPEDDLAGVRELVIDGTGVTPEAASVRIVVTAS